jgi:biofilm PGA synthesis N-glycosyltransferase PgaC
LQYALITPARDEASNLRRLIPCLLEQAVQPSMWVVVDNGSSDDTGRLIRDLAEERSWVRLIEVEGSKAAEPGQPIVRAFHAGLAELPGPVDVVVKLDADVSMEPSYFERLLAVFEADPSLGIASGSCFEQVDGRWVETHVTEAAVRGATRAYRWACLQGVLPLEERVGWDGIDELKANVQGWRTAIVHDLPFRHHRPVGARDGAATTRWVRQGRASHYMGYRLPYIVLRTMHRARRDRAAVAMLWGYLGALIRREPRYGDEAVRNHLRERQSLRKLPLRMREASGRRDS